MMGKETKEESEFPISYLVQSRRGRRGQQVCGTELIQSQGAAVGEARTKPLKGKLQAVSQRASAIDKVSSQIQVCIGRN